MDEKAVEHCFGQHGEFTMGGGYVGALPTFAGGSDDRCGRHVGWTPCVNGGVVGTIYANRDKALAKAKEEAAKPICWGPSNTLDEHGVIRGPGGGTPPPPEAEEADDE